MSKQAEAKLVHFPIGATQLRKRKRVKLMFLSAAVKNTTSVVRSAYYIATVCAYSNIQSI